MQAGGACLWPLGQGFNAFWVWGHPGPHESRLVGLRQVLTGEWRVCTLQPGGVARVQGSHRLS